MYILYTLIIIYNFNQVVNIKISFLTILKFNMTMITVGCSAIQTAHPYDQFGGAAPAASAQAATLYYMKELYLYRHIK